MMLSARRWLSEVLPWLIVAMLALWWPPMLTLLAARAGLIADSGFAPVSDPGTLASLVELVLMTFAVRLLLKAPAAGFRWLVWSRIAALARLAWTVLALSRLNGITSTLREQTVCDSVAMLLVSAALLYFVRPEFQGDGRAHRRGNRSGLSVNTASTPML
jgi:hypothetical protein